MPVLARGRPSAVFAEVVGDWAPVESPPPIEDPSWPTTQLAPLVDSARGLGAELWLMEPTDPSGAHSSRFTAAEKAAIRTLGAGLVRTLPSALPPDAMGAAGHITPAWKERASAEAGAWLRANPPSAALSGAASPRAR